ncbi:MAG: pantoate--beta-alanine ligase [Methylococcales bacterium]|jgi:pantoate--beta-alanine ligase|nr:pantoate--beta-alanine ligase [Methylococcales bacterium]
MKIINHITDIQDELKTVRFKNKTIAFVPTMGNLHQGHLELIKQAGQLADIVVVSIFVNPGQFGPAEDYDSYPRTLQQDIDSMQAYQVDFVFAPDSREIYPEGNLNSTKVSNVDLSSLHCGQSRPIFFTGVATVVAKLFNIILPDVAVFGQKDFQQLTIIRQMVNDLNYPIKIHGVATIREKDGLAMSSRNAYLSPSDRKTAAHIYQILSQLKQRIELGEVNFDQLQMDAGKMLSNNGFDVDYVHIVASDTLLPPIHASNGLVILLAAFLNGTRLIDNIILE